MNGEPLGILYALKSLRDSVRMNTFESCRKTKEAFLLKQHYFLETHFNIFKVDSPSD